MKVILDKKIGTKTVIFEKFEINKGQKFCPKCNRAFKERDIELLSVNGHITCSKCGSKLSYTN